MKRSRQRLHPPASEVPSRAAGCWLGLQARPHAQAVLDDGRKRELQTVIQAHFKDWLHTSGNLRQVYDLARMEREDAAQHPS